MKSLKKALAVLLSVAMLASVAAPVAAATDDPESPVTSTATLDEAQVKVGALTFTGKAQNPKVTVKLDGKTLVQGKDFKITSKKQWAAGTYELVLEGITYEGTYTTTFTIKPDAKGKMFVKQRPSKLKVTIGKTESTKKTIKAKWMKKGARTYIVGVTRAAKTALDKKAKVTASKVKVPKKLRKYVTITKKNNGKFRVTFKKNAPKGSYKITFTSAETVNYKKATKNVVFTIK